MFMTKNVNFSCEDDPFEVKLGENYAVILNLYEYSYGVLSTNTV